MAKRKSGGSWQQQTGVSPADAARDHKEFIEDTTEAERHGSLRLGPIEYRRPDDLRPSPFNQPFEALKDREYWDALRRDISESGAITEPLLIDPDNEIVSGHSRQKVAAALLSEGRTEFEKIPVRVIHSELSQDDRRKRVYLGNLSRFEIDPDTRLTLYAEIYPDYFQAEQTGRPKKADTVSAFAPKDIAAVMGLSDRQLRRDKQIYQQAQKTAADKGLDKPTAAEIKRARIDQNKTRRGYIASEIDIDEPAEAEAEAPDTPPVTVRGDNIIVAGAVVATVRRKTIESMEKGGVIDCSAQHLRSEIKSIIEQHTQWGRT